MNLLRLLSIRSYWKILLREYQAQTRSSISFRIVVKGGRLEMGKNTEKIITKRILRIKMFFFLVAAPLDSQKWRGGAMTKRFTLLTFRLPKRHFPLSHANLLPAQSRSKQFCSLGAPHPRHTGAIFFFIFLHFLST